MKEVFPAQPYQPRNMGSTGRAEYMLLRQFEFPDAYDEHLDILDFADHDRLLGRGGGNVEECFKRHIGTGSGGLQGWLENAADLQVMNFLKDLLGADSQVTWTGYRILGTVNRMSGFPVWTLELFAKHPASRTTVRSDNPAQRFR